MGTRTFTLEERLYGALESFQIAQAQKPSREGALIVTKLEEAALWNDEKRRLMGLPPLGLGWRP